MGTSSSAGIIFADAKSSCEPAPRAKQNERKTFWDTEQIWGWREWTYVTSAAAVLVFLVALVAVTRPILQSYKRRHAPAASSHPFQPAVAQFRAGEQISGPATVGAIHYLSDDQSTTVSVDLTGRVFFRANRLNQPDRIYFDLHGARMPTGLHGKTIEANVAEPCVSKIRVAEWKPEVTRVVLETAGKCDYSAMIASPPYKLVVKLRPSD